MSIDEISLACHSLAVICVCVMVYLISREVSRIRNLAEMCFFGIGEIKKEISRSPRDGSNSTSSDKDSLNESGEAKATSDPLEVQ